MARTKYDMTLTEEERDLLTRIVAEGKESDRTILRAHILLLSDWKKNPNTTTRQVAESVGTSCTTVQTVHAEYGKYGLEAALYRKDRLKTRSNDDISGKIVELSEQDPPAGNKRWSNRLLAEEAVKHGIVDKISVATVSKIMRAHNPSPIDRKDIVAEIVALSRKRPPKGKRWSLAMLCEESVKKGIVPQIGRSTMYNIMRKYNPDYAREFTEECQ